MSNSTMTTKHDVKEGDATRAGEADYVHVTGDKLLLEVLTRRVSSPAAGAIASFCGTTRDNFNRKKVLRLIEYEAYTPMALKEMREICGRMRKQWDLIKIALVHRIGEVPVEESSVMVVASSAHRREALEAVQYGIDEIKARVPIWKKEVYEDGSMWKENCEGCHHQPNSTKNNNDNNNHTTKHTHTHAKDHN